VNIALTDLPLFFAAGEAAPSSGIFEMLPAFVAIGFLFYFMILLPERRKQKSHRTQLEGLKKNDRVVTIGGIYGTVMNVQRDTDEVTIKVDEATNTKLRMTLSSIARVVGDETSTDKAAADTSPKSI
jgi:preprotein translocase subunit YajC